MPVEVADVNELLDVLAGAGVSAIFCGGWGVDALAGEQTRLHDDADLWVAIEDDGASPSPATGGPLTMVTHSSIEGACSWQASFAVPDVSPGVYPITVLSVGAVSSAMAGHSLTFEVTAP